MRWVRSGLGLIFGAWVLTLAILGGLVIGTTLVLPFVVIPRGRRERYTIVGAQLWARFVLRPTLMCDVKVSGEDGLQPGQGAIYLCNHRSWLDPLLLIAHTRSNGLSKFEILFIPVIGLYGWLTGAVFFDRRRKDARQRARAEVMKLVSGGAKVQVFPEGTRSRDGRLKEKVYLTLAMDCYADGVPVVPCAVWGTEDVLPPGRFVAWPGQTAHLVVRPALHPRDFPSAEDFARAAWDAVVAEVRAFEAGGRT